MKVTLDLQRHNKAKLPFPEKALARKVLTAVLKEEKLEKDAEINLVLTGPEEIRDINRAFRGIDRETDVLSFPGIEFDSPADWESALTCNAGIQDPDTGAVVLGDIVLNVSRVLSQAEEYGHSEIREFAFLIAHSALHLCGYDHETPEEAKVMEEKQEAVLTKLGITREV